MYGKNWVFNKPRLLDTMAQITKILDALNAGQYQSETPWQRGYRAGQTDAYTIALNAIEMALEPET